MAESRIGSCCRGRGVGGPPAVALGGGSSTFPGVVSPSPGWFGLVWRVRGVGLGNARDRFIVLALWRIGSRRGELTGVRLEDVHFVPDATRLGCRIRGEHLHVHRRANSNGATAKSRRSRAIPVDWFVVQAHDQYMLERGACPQARRCDFLLVNLFREPLGAPMRPRALNELLADLSRRAGLDRGVHPHQLRHSMASNVAAAGGTLDEIRELLGHSAVTSSQVYLHPSPDRLRAAVERVERPRGQAGKESR